MAKAQLKTHKNLFGDCVMSHLSFCTISFRHQLISLPELASWGQKSGFQGIELWGAHAKNLSHIESLNAQWLQDFNLSVSMISDYLSLDKPKNDALAQCQELCSLAQRWQTSKLRTFAGNKGSADTHAEEFLQIVSRLRFYCHILEEHGLNLLIETHPNTFADTTESTLKLLDAVSCNNLKVNFDVLHIWEAGEDAVNAWHKLFPYIQHMHLKNISQKKFLNVFEPSNIYAAAGSREGIVPTFDGLFNYMEFFNKINSTQQASFEWFGPNMQRILSEDRQKLSYLNQSLHTITESTKPSHAIP